MQDGPATSDGVAEHASLEGTGIIDGGSWSSYTSDESGPNQVYVRPFTGAGPRVMVSNAGGATASWSRGRAELVFAGTGTDYQQSLMVVSYRTDGGSIHVDKPRPWADRSVGLRSLRADRTFALYPDGARVAIAAPSEADTAPRSHLTFVSNLFDHLRTIAPPHP